MTVRNNSSFKWCANSIGLQYKCNHESITVFFFLEGSTHFHYLKKGEEVTLSCETCQWQADVNSDNKVDCNIIGSIYTTTSICPTRRQDLCQEIKRNKPTSCEIRVMRGFFACVNATSDSCFMYPFKPSSHHVESFIVAQAEPDSKCKCSLPFISTASWTTLHFVYFISTFHFVHSCVWTCNGKLSACVWRRIN